MSEENMNNNSNEETAALFVSSQKKKAAEEEARRKAEAEQAKRDAAEAEVLRMEQEVEERRRRAEEEKRALEEAERLEAAKAKQLNIPKPSVNVDAIKEKAAAAAGAAKEAAKGEGKSKLPLFIGIGAAALVLIIVLAVVLGGKGKKGKVAEIDYSALEFNKEYKVKEEGYDFTLKYPESLYNSVEEESDGDCLTVTLGSEDSGIPQTSFLLFKLEDAGNLGLQQAKKMADMLAGMKDLIPDEGVTNIVEQNSTDITSDEPGKYFGNITAETEKGAYTATACMVSQGNGSYLMPIIMLYQEGKNLEEIEKNLVALRDLFDANNSEGAVVVPGGNPPTSTDTDGMLEVDEIHLGLIMPKDRFKRVETDKDCLMWADDNGALVIVAYDTCDYTFDEVKSVKDEYYTAVKEGAQSGINDYFDDVESRNFLDDATDYNDRLAYMANYRDVYGGITYWEGFYSSMWRDVRTQEYYFYDVIMLAPEKDKDIYKPLLEKSIDRVQDI